jgi:DNA-binding transcriptional regulator YdaS (Cro superfamily)
MDKTKQKLLEYFGNQKNLAKALGVMPSSVSRWGKIDGKIPELHRYKIEILTKGEFTFAQLSKVNWLKKEKN